MEDRSTKIMDEQLASYCLKQAGYTVENIERILEGGSHHNFDVQLKSGGEVIAKFDKPLRLSPDGRKRDYHYNGGLSLEREAALCSLVRNKVGLPAPKTKGIYRLKEHKFLVAEKMPGVHWNSFIRQHDFSLDRYLESLAYLGTDIAQVQRWKFKSYGNVIDEKNIEPDGMVDFAERLRQITILKLDRARKTNSLKEKEIKEVEFYFTGNIRMLRNLLQRQDSKPTLVLTDLHPTNFLVDNNGKPSGYTDLEFCQSGHPAMEFYLLNLQFFSYFNQCTFEMARSSFFQEFTAQGGSYNIHDSTNQQLEKILGAQHILAAVTAYYGQKDGLRDTWSQRFKDLLFKIMNTDKVDYAGFADIVREKTKQPKNPTLP